MPGQSKIQLTVKQIDELDTIRFKAKAAAVYRNATIVLMSNAGRSKPSIAEALGCGTATVERARRLYQTLGIIGLTPIKPPGRPSRLSKALREPVLAAIQADPRTFGYGFTTWTIPRLAEHLDKRCGLRAGVSTVRRVLAHEQFSLQRPKHTLKGKCDEHAHDAAQASLKVLKKNAPQECGPCTCLLRRNRNPQAPAPDSNVGAEGSATTRSGAGQEREEGRLWRRGLRHRTNHDPDQRYQERTWLHLLSRGASTDPRPPQDSADLRQCPLPPHPGGA